MIPSLIETTCSAAGLGPELGTGEWKTRKMGENAALVSPGFRDIGPEEAAELCRAVERAITTTAAEVSYLVLRVRNVSSK